MNNINSLVRNLNPSVRSGAIQLYFANLGEKEILIVRKNDDIAYTLQEVFNEQLESQGFKIIDKINAESILCIE